MERDVIGELIQLLTSESNRDAGAVDADTPLFEGGLDLDSFAVVEIVTMVESHFDIQLSEDDFAPENFANIRTLAGIVERYLPASASASAAE